ncbi:uncharacterized protein RBU33_007159 isoform 2-T2 [Hipposideros larvatus]
MKVAVARAGAAAVRARGAECGGGGGSWSLEPGAPAEAGAGRDGSTAWTSLHCRQSWGWTGWESRKWTPFSWERECQPPAKGARDCSPLEENDVSSFTIRSKSVCVSTPAVDSAVNGQSCRMSPLSEQHSRGHTTTTVTAA